MPFWKTKDFLIFLFDLTRELLRYGFRDNDKRGPLDNGNAILKFMH